MLKGYCFAKLAKRTEETQVEFMFLLGAQFGFAREARPKQSPFRLRGLAAGRLLREKLAKANVLSHAFRIYFFGSWPPWPISFLLIEKKQKIKAANVNGE